MKAIAALNVYKKVAIIRRPSDALSYEDVEGNLRTITDLGEAVSATTPLINKKPKHDIPVPRITLVETYERDVPANFEIPTSYVRYKRPTRIEMMTNLEYVADAEDELWLQQNMKFGSGSASKPTPTDPFIALTTATSPIVAYSKGPPLPLGMFEIMLDSLEKATAFEAIVTLDQAERLIGSKLPQIYHMYATQGRVGTVTVKHVIQDVYNYWVQKRSKLKRPLLRRFWPVTSTDDTNPHLVFRPREKEKYKLRKKRQNDMDAYRKMKQLRSDFDNLRALLELVKRREELNRCSVMLQCELFQQRLYDLIDTSGWPRLSTRINRDEVDRLLDVPKLFEPQESNSGTGKKGKKRKKEGEDSLLGSRAGSGTGSNGTGSDKDAFGRTIADGTAASTPKAIIAGQNGGDPAPNFMHPLQTRESYVSSWDNAVPAVTSYVDSHPTPTFRFRHRPRIGRGGRVVIDRLPHPAHPNVTPITVFTAGIGLPRSVQPKPTLLDLLPRPLDYPSISRRIEELCVDLLEEDRDPATTATGAVASDVDDNDCDAVMVKINDWLDTDDQLWGEERFPPIGPL